MTRKEISKEKALERLVALCNRSEQCEADIINKMIGWRLASADRNEILETLRNQSLVDNSRFAKAYAGDKARFSYWGPQKIRAELIKRRIPSNIITEALHNVEAAVWKNSLLHSADVKAKNLDLIGEDARADLQKLYRYLVSRGFPSASVTKVVSLMKKKQLEVRDVEMD